MKVAMVASGLSRAGAGLTAAVEAWSRAVLDTGVEVRVFGLEDAGWLGGDKDTWRGAPAIAFPIVGPRALGYAPDMAKGLSVWAPDIVHLHSLWLHPSRSVHQWARKTGRPYMISPHGTLAPAALRFSPLKKRIASALYQSRTLDDATCLHATCDAEFEEIRAFGLTQAVAVVPNGIRIADFPESSVSTKRKSVISLGRVHPKKGLDRLVRAWAEVEPSFSDWTLEIVGPSEIGYAADLRSLATELDLKRVRIEDAIFGAEKIRRLTEASLFALPTLNENFALTVAESLSCGTPVIATMGAPWSGLAQQGCGWWIDHGPEPMAAALRTAMSMSDEERRSMGMRGRAWMDRDFSFASIARIMTDVYQWMLFERDRPGCVREAV